MSFRVNTNIAAMNAHAQGNVTNRELSSSLEKLSSGLRINKAADDASGMAIADSLRNQANSLGQAIRNANDTIGIIQTADKAMDEQVKILDTIKTKATQAAQDGQTGDTRKALQADIVRLLEELDNISFTTSFNGQNLLAGTFSNKEFQIGAYSNETIKASIGATNAAKIGSTRFETGSNISASSEVTLSFSAVDGVHDVTLESVVISTGINTGVGALAETINKNSDTLGGIKASWTVLETAPSSITSGSVTGLTINGVSIGDIGSIQANDRDGRLVNAINNVKDLTGTEAYIDTRGNLNLRSTDGRGIAISGTGVDTILGLASTTVENYGRLTLTKFGAKDIIVSATGGVIGFDSGSVSETVINAGNVRGGFNQNDASAMGAFANSSVELYGQQLGAGVTTLTGAMSVMNIADNAIKFLNSIRSDLGSVQNQLISTINNITTTQVNVKSSESGIRDVDFAEESANFNKHNLLAQSGSFAMSQANQVQQNVMKLLQ
jgi:flagellin